MGAEPIRHHYIPQFILRKFSNPNGKINYYDKESGKWTEKESRDIFMERNLYRVENEMGEYSVQIEHDLASFESEIAHLINENILIDTDISLSIFDWEKLKLFIAIMAFRSSNTRRQFLIDMSEANKDFFRKYQKNGNLDDFWKRNLSALANCRTIGDVASSKEIDEPIKAFMFRDTNGLTYYKYITVAECREGDEFVLGDAYPTIIEGVSDDGTRMDMYEIIPVSPKRIVLLVNDGADTAPKEVRKLSKGFFVRPKLSEDRQKLSIHVKKMDSQYVEYINSEIVKTAHSGYVCRKRNNKYHL